ncbi:MAG: HlyC/CorC family transporter [Clostridiales bacterium]|nr:HlyC/CorC family transporter [Clostridiales bacterium]
MFPSILAMLFCIIMSAYFSATETAFSSLNKTRLKVLADGGNKRAALALRLSEDYDKLISTILIGNNIVNIALASIGTLLFVGLLGDIGATVSTASVTVLVLIFGEITPKSIAKDNPEKFAMFSSPLINLLIKVLTPVNFLFSKWKKMVSRLFKSDGDSKMSQEELLQLVDEVQQEGSIDKSEGELLRNAIEFRDLIAEDILTHRVDLEGVEVDATKEEIARAFTQSRYSRLLVYRESIDDIVGVIHQKDFYVNGGVTEKPLAEIMTPPVFIHQYEKIRDLLKFLQAHKSHIAIVIDEYGGTLGIVTMEDILEELVGEIWDEHDEVVESFKKLDEDSFLVDCLVNLDDFREFFDLDFESDSVSVGGWVMEQMERIPQKGESFRYEDLIVTVTEVEARRVSYIKVVRVPKPEETNE